MTDAELRDQLAKAMKWKRCPRHPGADSDKAGWVDPKGGTAMCCTAIPVPDLSTVAALGWAARQIREAGCIVLMTETEMIAKHNNGAVLGMVPRTSNDSRDMAMLLVKALEAKGATMDKGWECPHCHKINGPQVRECSCRPSDRQLTPPPCLPPSIPWEPQIPTNLPAQSNCLHDNCPECGGTGRRKDGLGACVHMISCPCPKCSPWCSTVKGATNGS